jgi:glycosyltransferase involved in cell wall biosynthesis
MNILVVNWQDRTNPQAGGAEVHFHEIFSRIARRGHRVTLCCSAYRGSLHRETIDGIEIIRRGSRAFFNFRFPFTWFASLRSRPFDCVVEDLNKLPLFTPLYVRRPLAGIGHHLFGRSIFLETGPLVARYVYWMERAALALYRTRIPFMVVSPSTREEFIAHGFPAARLAVIHNCVDHARYTAVGAPKSPDPLIGCFGRLKKYKSVDHLLRALPLVRERVPAVRAVIAGEGDDRPRLEAIAASLGLGTAVQFAGYVAEEQKIVLLQSMWCKVATSSKEGWGLTVIEANACGTPAIASDVPGLRDSVRDNETGLLYPYGDVEALARRIILLLEDAALRRRLSEGAVGWAKQFDWETAADRTIEFLERARSNPAF